MSSDSTICSCYAALLAVGLAVAVPPANAGGTDAEAGAAPRRSSSPQHARVGLEVGYTGRRALEYDPYGTVSPGFVELNRAEL